ncbi:pentapeptide repeat-containing protein [Maricaulis sp.]|uniref:pentapeptide repeat-containing protein n=1 Tax=Maricaulis sp. TaxID=1486257 RepID=UPI003298F39F
MASVDAVAAIVSGRADWDDYIKAVPGEVDLTFADLNLCDLSGRSMERCNFSGAQLSGANLDRTLIKDCCFSGANLSQISLVGAELHEVTASNLIAAGIVVRKSRWSNVELENCQLDHAQFNDCDLNSCNFAGVTGTRLTFVNLRQAGGSIKKLQVAHLSAQDARWKDCELHDWTVDQIEATACAVHGGGIRNVVLRAGNLADSGFVNQRIERLQIEPAHVVSRNLDFSESTLVGMDLKGVGLASATMLDTAVINCVWPRQDGFISAVGRFIPNTHLLRQPVQDLRGVPPVTRRQIANAQYIVRLQEHGSDGVAQLGLALWGLTTGFGQSLLRLSLTTLLFLAMGTLLLLAARGQLVGHLFVPTLLYGAWSDAFASFFALSNSGRSPTGLEGFVLGLNRILGFVALGLWVSVGANRLGKLGAE